MSNGKKRFQWSDEDFEILELPESDESRQDYDPDQPRDENGQWGEDGSSGGSTSRESSTSGSEIRSKGPGAVVRERALAAAAKAKAAAEKGDFREAYRNAKIATALNDEAFDLGEEMNLDVGFERERSEAHRELFNAVDPDYGSLDGDEDDRWGADGGFEGSKSRREEIVEKITAERGGKELAQAADDMMRGQDAVRDGDGTAAEKHLRAAVEFFEDDDPELAELLRPQLEHVQDHATAQAQLRQIKEEVDAKTEELEGLAGDLEEVNYTPRQVASIEKRRAKLVEKVEKLKAAGKDVEDAESELADTVEEHEHAVSSVGEAATLREKIEKTKAERKAVNARTKAARTNLRAVQKKIERAVRTVRGTLDPDDDDDDVDDVDEDELEDVDVDINDREDGVRRDEFDPDQPRDENGQFASTGGSASGPRAEGGGRTVASGKHRELAAKAKESQRKSGEATTKGDFKAAVKHAKEATEHYRAATASAEKEARAKAAEPKVVPKPSAKEIKLAKQIDLTNAQRLAASGQHDEAKALFEKHGVQYQATKSPERVETENQLRALQTAGKLPKGVTPEQHYEIATKFLAKHAENLDESKAKLSRIIGKEVDGRVKSVDSAVGKVLRKPKYGTAEKLQDGTGLRAVTSSVSESRDAVAKIEAEYKIVTKDDYTDKPQSGGYRAIHLVVEDEDGLLKEVQIQTGRQRAFQDWSHDVYKPQTADQRAALVTHADEANNYGVKVSNYLYEKDKGNANASPPPDPSPEIVQAFGKPALD